MEARDGELLVLRSKAAFCISDNGDFLCCPPEKLFLLGPIDCMVPSKSTHMATLHGEKRAPVARKHGR
jgi:hypothetical protein